MSDQRINHLIDKVGIDYQDRRSNRRGPGMLSACSICGDDGRLIDCVLLDISAVGAKVKFDQSSGDAEGVNLRSAKRLKIAAAFDFPVEVIWQDGLMVGLRFLSDPHEVAGALNGLLSYEGMQFDSVERDDD